MRSGQEHGETPSGDVHIPSSPCQPLRPDVQARRWHQTSMEFGTDESGLFDFQYFREHNAQDCTKAPESSKRTSRKWTAHSLNKETFVDRRRGRNLTS